LPGELRRFFWDVAFEKLTIEKHSRFLVERILNYGDMNAIKWLLTWAKQDFIKTIVDKSRNLNAKSKNFWKIKLDHLPE
jgi:hypothetical protein